MPDMRSSWLRFCRTLRLGLMYMGANAWPCAEVFDALRRAANEAPTRARRSAADASTADTADTADQAEDPPPVAVKPHPEGVTPYADLSPSERRLLDALKQQLGP
ncbi:hypothetical protein AB0J52_22485 [Spirillospora sp. NPDC049652]